MLADPGHRATVHIPEAHGLRESTESILSAILDAFNSYRTGRSSNESIFAA